MARRRASPTRMLAAIDRPARDDHRAPGCRRGDRGRCRGGRCDRRGRRRLGSVSASASSAVGTGNVDLGGTWLLRSILLRSILLRSILLRSILLRGLGRHRLDSLRSLALVCFRHPSQLPLSRAWSSFAAVGRTQSHGILRCDVFIDLSSGASRGGGAS